MARAGQRKFIPVASSLSWYMHIVSPHSLLQDLCKSEACTHYYFVVASLVVSLHAAVDVQSRENDVFVGC